MIQWIFWDNDGVLVDTEHLYFSATQQVLAKVGFELTLDLYREYFLVQSAGVWHLAGLPAELTEELRRERNRLYGELLLKGDIVLPGVKPVLQKLKDHFRMGIVTSSRRDHFDVIHRASGLTEFFSFVLARDDYSESKPDPEPYLRAIALTGRDACECLVIEDSERGLVAAKRAGLECWVIPGGLSRGGSFAQADKVLESIDEVVFHLLGRGIEDCEPRPTSTNATGSIEQGEET